MVLLVGIIVCIVIAAWWTRSAQTSERENESRYKLRLDAAQAWLKQRTENHQQIEMICGPVPLGLDSDESVVFVLPGVRLLEPRAIRRSSSAYGGPTIRVAKGLSFRLGAGVNQSESSDELRDIDQGTLVLTTKRLAFMGSMRTRNGKLDDIIGIQTYTDGIQVHRERKDRAETYVLGQTLQILEGSGRGLTVISPMIKTAIEVAKVLHENPVATPREVVENEATAASYVYGELKLMSMSRLQTDILAEPPNPIRLCVTCRSKDLSYEPQPKRFVCNECGTRLEQVDDKFRLDPDSRPQPNDASQSLSEHSRTWAKAANGILSDIEIWHKYAGQTLWSREWANIANGGFSDGEIIAGVATHVSVAPVAEPARKPRSGERKELFRSG